LLFLVSYSIVWVLTSDCCNFSQRLRHGKRKNAQKKFEHPPKPVVYYSMDNLRGRLGSTRQVRGLGCNADSSTNFSSLKTVGRHPNRKPCWIKAFRGLPDEENVSEGIIEGKMSVNSLSDLSPLQIFSERFDARLHGAGINDEENAGQRRTRKSATLGDRGLALVAEQWTHNPCAEEGMHTRSQQLYFGGGETRHANAETSLIFGEISEVRQPASFSL
jgi:hypothetical protein